MQRHVLVIALVSVAAAGSAAAAGPDYNGVGQTASPAGCPMSKPTPAAAPAARPGPQRLDRLPPAAHQLTVLKSVGGCPVATLKVGRQTYDVPIPLIGRPTPAGETTRMR